MPPASRAGFRAPWSDRLYLKLCRAIGFSAFKRLQRAPEQLRENLEFIGIDVQPEEVVAFAISASFIGAALALLILAVGTLLGTPPSHLAPIVAVPPLAYVAIGWYPKWRAEQERVRGLGEVPMLVSYMVMAMKVRSNLERAAEFAAQNARGALGKGLRKALWGASLRAHASVEEALEKFSALWGRWSEDLKRSIHLIRSSTLERSGRRRLETLNKALEISLRGAQDRMQRFASGLYLPTFMIYSIGVLLPLVLVAILPVLSVIGICVSAWHIFIIYCFALPLAVWGLGKWVLAKRPVAFPPPEVPSRGNRARAAALAVLVGAATACPAIARALGLQVPLDLSTFSILWSMTLSLVIYLHLTTSKPYKLSTSIKRMEDEFCDSLVQLGNRMAEGRPAEDAFENIAAMGKSSISDIFAQASNNIKLGSMGLRAALFDEERGALRQVYSRMIRDTLQMLVDIIERSTRAAGDVMLRLADHLQKLKQVEADIQRALGEVVTSMRSVALFFAPLIAAVASRLQGVFVPKVSAVPFLDAGTSISPPAFLLALGVYVIALVIILMSYSVEIELGDDPLSKRAAIARGVPIAVGVFTTSAILSGRLLKLLIG